MGRDGVSPRGAQCPSICLTLGQRLRAHLLLVLIISGCVIGFIVGAAVNGPVNRIKDPAERKTVVMLIGFPGELLMNMLKVRIVVWGTRMSIRSSL